MAQHRHDNRQADNGGVVPLRVFPKTVKTWSAKCRWGSRGPSRSGEPSLPTQRQGSKGGRGNKASDNVPGFERGNSADYTLGRLMRDNPELADEVAKGEISAHAITEPLTEIREL
jgi:hypothetical protein